MIQEPLAQPRLPKKKGRNGFLTVPNGSQIPQGEKGEVGTSIN